MVVEERVEFLLQGFVAGKGVCGARKITVSVLFGGIPLCVPCMCMEMQGGGATVSRGDRFERLE